MATILLPGGPAPRTASVTEDPARRRINGGGRVQFVYQLIPLMRPEIVSALGGLSIFHADFGAGRLRNPSLLLLLLPRNVVFLGANEREDFLLTTLFSDQRGGQPQPSSRLQGRGDLEDRGR